MPILSKGKPRPATIQCVRETVVGVSIELLDPLRFFYTQVIGLKPWEQTWQIPGGWGLGDRRRGLFLEYRHDPDVDPMKRRFTVEVAGLEPLRERLAELEWPHERVRGFGWSDQFILVRDPVGHLIEVRQSQPL